VETLRGGAGPGPPPLLPLAPLGPPALEDGAGLAQRVGPPPEACAEVVGVEGTGEEEGNRERSRRSSRGQREASMDRWAMKASWDCPGAATRMSAMGWFATTPLPTS
jgi:hypothetical protein